MNAEKKALVKKFSIILLIGAIVGSQVATQVLAHEVEYDPIIGTPLGHLQGVPIYAPYLFWFWQAEFADFIPHLIKYAMGTFYVCLLISGMICMAIVKYNKKSISHGSASWAKKEDVETALPDGEGVILGWNPYKKKFLYHDGKEHIALLAPTRSGKGVGIIIPTALTWKHSMFVTDLKAENWEKTATYRKKYLNNKVLKFAPLRSDGSSVKYNPLSEIAFRKPEESGDVMNICNMIVDPDGKGLEDHWAKTGQALLVGVVIHLLYAHEKEGRKPPTLSDVATFLSSPDRDYTEQIHRMKVYPHITVDEALSEDNIFQKIYGEYIRDIRSYAKDKNGEYMYQWTDKDESWLPEWNGERAAFSLNNLKADIKYRMDHGEEIDWKSEFTGKDRDGNMHYNYAALLTHPKAAEAAAEMENRAANEASSVLSTAMSFLSLYRDPIIAANTSISEFQVEDLMNPKQPVSLFLVIPPGDLQRVRPLVRLIITLTLRKLTPEIQKGEPEQKCLFLLDEFPRFGKLQEMQDKMAIMAGYGLKVLMVSQDIKMINDAYGKDNSILSNCGVRIFFTPNELETASNISDELGDETIEVRSRNDNGKLLSGSTSSSEIARKLMTKDEVLHFNKENELILVSGEKPIMTKKIRYFKEKYFTEKVLPEPEHSDKCTIIDSFSKAAVKENKILTPEEELRNSLKEVS